MKTNHFKIEKVAIREIFVIKEQKKEDKDISINLKEVILFQITQEDKINQLESIEILLRLSQLEI